MNSTPRCPRSRVGSWKISQRLSRTALLARSNHTDSFVHKTIHQPSKGAFYNVESTCKDKNMKLMFRLATIWGSYVSHTCSWLPCSPSIPSLPLFYLPKIPPSCVLHSNPRKCSCPCLTLASYYASHCQSLYECYRGDHWYFLAATYRLAGNDGIICSIVAEWMWYLGKIASLTRISHSLGAEKMSFY